MTASLERVGREMAMTVYVDIYQIFDRYLANICLLDLYIPSLLALLSVGRSPHQAHSIGRAEKPFLPCNEWCAILME
jgi:hypothetical protein